MLVPLSKNLSQTPEMVFISPTDEINIAKGKPTNHISDWDYGRSYASYAVDGNKDQNYYRRSCSHTNLHLTTW